jgi:hypothetical protein
MRASLISIVVTLVLLFSHPADAVFIFDFTTADRTFLGSGPLGAGAPNDPVVASMPVPGSGDFAPVAGSTHFLVGNLTNFCGLFPGNPTSTKSGTACDMTAPFDGGDLSGTINYPGDSFVLAADTLLQLQMIVKLGHPERPLDDSSRSQDQDERFDVYLKNNGTTLELAQLLDDVSTTDGEVQNGYYLYVYDPMIVPAGTWYPSFVSRSGSIEFLTQLSGLSTPIPEPGTVFLFASGLVGLAFAGWRRRRLP